MAQSGSALSRLAGLVRLTLCGVNANRLSTAVAVLAVASCASLAAASKARADAGDLRLVANTGQSDYGEVTSPKHRPTISSNPGARHLRPRSPDIFRWLRPRTNQILITDLAWRHPKDRLQGERPPR